jgi:hypothetical protein
MIHITPLLSRRHGDKGFFLGKEKCKKTAQVPTGQISPEPEIENTEKKNLEPLGKRLHCLSKKWSVN